MGSDVGAIILLFCEMTILCNILYKENDLNCIFCSLLMEAFGLDIFCRFLVYRTLLDYNSVTSH